MNTHTLSFERFVQATPSQVYHAFTNATALREWVCDVSTTDAKPGGRVYMAWNSGYYMAGEFLTLEPGHLVVFSWFGRGDPKPTQVRITLSEKDGGVLVHLDHEQIGSSSAWKKAIKEIQEGWTQSLENLASVLGAGEDLRITLRPLLGINPGEFNADIANKLGVPTIEGIRLDGVVDGLGAQVAGMQANDVIIHLGKHTVKNFADLRAAIEGKRAGDRLKIVFYRGSKKKVATLELSRRPMPNIPPTLRELVEQTRQLYAQMESDLNEFFAHISETEAAFSPAPEEWSTKEVLAHMIQAEYFWRQRAGELVSSQESWVDEFAGNFQPAITATLTAYPSLAELLAYLKRQYIETQALFANLPEQIVERKGTYWRLAAEALQMPYHFNAHIEQIKAAVQAYRDSAAP